MIVKEHPLTSGAPPLWASEWGEDALGPWCAFEIQAVTQVLRWIPPGQFMMGSPADEAGRHSDEGPQHWVTIGYGFWMFDTPCTQELWQAVMDADPSHFKGAKRPVETVSWDDSRNFTEATNQLLPTLNLRLPTEAEWEYACRAGSSAATYANLEAIAWFEDNSEGQTHDVKRKQPNVRGLYDTIGNVWEWCLDSAHREYDAVEIHEPLFFDSATAYRVIRGGAWRVPALGARAAYRDADRPSLRYRNLGLRCLSSAEPSSADFDGAEMSNRGSGPLRSRPDRDRE